MPGQNIGLPPIGLVTACFKNNTIKWEFIFFSGTPLHVTCMLCLIICDLCDLHDDILV